MVKKSSLENQEEEKDLKYDFKYKVKIRNLPQKTKRKELKKVR